MEYFKDNDFFEKMEKVAVPKLDAARTSGYYTAYDGIKIYYDKFKNKNEKAIIVISHGFCEFAEKFEEVIYYFLCKGYSVYIPEHRGHGNSDRETDDLSKVYVDGFDKYVNDFYGFVRDIVRNENPGKKMVLYAHSMGGAIGALVLEQYPELFDCAVLTSPMLKMKFNGIPEFVANLLRIYAAIFPVKFKYVPPMLKMKFNGIPEFVANLLRIYAAIFPVKFKYVPGQSVFDGVRDEKFGCCTSGERYEYIFRKREKNDRYHMNGATYGWSISAMKATKKLQREAEKVKIPVLLFQASDDDLVDNRGQNRFAEKNKNVILIQIPNSKHEIYGSTYNTIKWYYEVIWKFLDKHLGGK